MSDQPNSVSTPSSASERYGRRSKGRRAAFVVIIALAAGLTGALATKALSQPFGFWHHGPMMGSTFNPARLQDRADRMVKHLAIEVDTTAEQQDKLRAVVKSAIQDLMPMREKFLAGRQQVRDILTQPTINRTELEKLRTDQLAQADAFSKRATQALADAAEILTPDQRRKLNDMLPPVGGFWRGWHRG